MDEQERINHDEWSRAANWRRLGTYRSAMDTRVFVPRKNVARGWTLNFAHRHAWWSLVGLSIVPFGLALLWLMWALFR